MCRLWQLMVGSGTTRLIAWGSLWQRQGNYICTFWQLIVGCDKAMEMIHGASDKITATTVTAGCEFWQECVIAIEVSAKQPIVQI